MEGKVHFKVLLLAVVFVGLIIKSNSVRIEREELVDRRLKDLNRPAKKSIQSEDGDIIDCVDIYKQPAFDHHLLKNHTIQMRPSTNSQNVSLSSSSSSSSPSSSSIVSQLWQKSGSCPKGTIPIRRVTKHDLLRAPCLQRYGMKEPETFRAVINGDSSIGLMPNHSVNIAVALGNSYHGGQVDLTVWNPFVEPDDYSTASMAFKSGPYDNFEAMEVGWMVNPKLFGDGRTRFYNHWTIDASRTTGCFNLLCPGFVQVSEKIVVGGVIDPVSQSAWEVYHISLAVFRDIKTGNWWLQYGTNELVGYWPSSIFGPLGHMAVAVQWGGDVYSPKIGKKPHTHTGMGSGQYGMDTFGSCSAAHMRVRDNAPTEYRPEKLATIIDEFDCYNNIFYPEHGEDRSFYFGGPGGKDFLCK